MITDYDWSVLNNEGVLAAIEGVAKAMEDTTVVDTDDLIQFGQVQAAYTPGNLYPLIAGEEQNLSLFRYRLRQDMTDHIRTERRRSNVTTHLADSAYESYEMDGVYYEPCLDLDVRGGYTEEVIHAVIPALWDESYAMRLDSNPLAPDPDMPRGRGGRISGPAHWDLIADVRRAWQGAVLELAERQAVFLTVGLGMPLREAGQVLGVSHVSIRNYTQRGMGKLVDFLSEGGNTNAVLV